MKPDIGKSDSIVHLSACYVNSMEKNAVHLHICSSGKTDFVKIVIVIDDGRFECSCTSRNGEICSSKTNRWT